MKRMICLLLSAALLLGLFSACRQSAPVRQDLPAKDLVETALTASGQEDGELERLTGQEDGGALLSAYLENAYQLEDPWEDAAVIRATGASAFELAVLRLEDEGTAVRAATALMNYISNRQGDFVGYAPEQADMAANGGILQSGPYAGLFICPDPDSARAAVLAALGSGDASQPVQNVTDVKELRDFLASSRGMDSSALEQLDGGDPESLSAYLADTYDLSEGQWEECAIAREESSAFEIAVVRASDAAGDVEQALNLYLNRREAQFEPASQQAMMLHRAIVISTGPYVVLLACENPEDAADAFAETAGTGGYGYSPRYRFVNTDPNYPDRCLFTPPNQDDMSLYDTSAIRAAWEKNDPAGLSDYDRDIYDQARAVLGKILQEGMSDYEKEAAIYNWVVNTVNYDWTHQDVTVQTPRESFTPYGGLVNHTAVCLGYATTFQLLCDLSGVECITVAGAAFESREDHGWNMVRLNGQWYCLDATWDANDRESSISWMYGQDDWRYFNVTSDAMADSDHQWDYANTPEATAEDQGRGAS